VEEFATISEHYIVKCFILGTLNQSALFWVGRGVATPWLAYPTIFPKIYIADIIITSLMNIRLIQCIMVNTSVHHYTFVSEFQLFISMFIFWAHVIQVHIHSLFFSFIHYFFNTLFLFELISIHESIIIFGISSDCPATKELPARL